ncbi:hypothetical protein LLEC1_07684, partial [Akanthomyces lecanii]
MEPAGKRRKLAPKLNASASSPPDPHSAPQHHKLPHPSQIVPDAPHHSQRQEFEAFARHLHDAAIIIGRQTSHPTTSYTDVSVLLLGWQDDSAAIENIRALQQVLVIDYRFHTQTWQIPTVANPTVKLSMQMASFLEQARPNQLLIIYYSGHGYVGPDGQLYWAWIIPPSYDGTAFAASSKTPNPISFYCWTPALFTTPSLPVIAACSPETARHPLAAARAYFSPCLVTALRQLSRNSSFSAQQLCSEIKIASRAHSTSWSRFPSPAPEPKFFTMTPSDGRNIEFAPLAQSSSDAATPETAHPRDSPSKPDSDSKLAFDEPRALVCTTFVGDASPDMSAFHSWLRNTPPLASQITVEGMFLGPPTVLLLSMPKPLWNNVQHDKIWYFLGTVSSRNMISQYHNMVGTSATPGPNEAATARPAPESTPTSAHSRQPSAAHWTVPGYAVKDEQTDGQASPTARLYQSLAAGGLGVKPKAHGEDSVEMQEAAEQLKALSHVRHQSGDAADTSPQRAALPAAMPTLHPGFRNLTRSESMPVLDGGTGSAGARMRRILGKPDIRCAHCSHAPFKDSSSLRKHIAAAHTRPFPCAFHFAGCTSTFGSKNEWKRHIASQHLCLQYYRCSICSQSTVDGKGNEFNRKDLFTQHLRRMHAPVQVKRAIAKGDNGQQGSEWEGYVRDMQQRCLIQRRHPPQRSSCPKPNCVNTFEGPTAWDEWTEHVGRHMEKGEGDNLGVDDLLLRYALDEGIVERVGDKEYRLVQVLGSGGAPSQPVSQAMSETHDSQAMSTQSSAPPPPDESPSQSQS